MIETSVLIVGGGPVGMTLALDLAWRGVDVTVVETRPAGEPPNVKCNQVSSRSMEVYRRLGVAPALRQSGLPPDYSNDVVSATSVTGKELSRLSLPSNNERQAGVQAIDSWWPTPESSYRINQTFFEPILYAHVSAQPRIRFLNRSEYQSFQQDEDGVTATIRNLDRGEDFSIHAKFMVGCDGSRSSVRKQIGGNFVGTSEIQRVQSTFIRAPELIKRLPGRPAWMYFSLNPRRCGTTIAIDGKETWNIHNFLYSGEESYDAIDRDWAIREILGVDESFCYDVISKEDWMGRRLVSDTFRDGRVFVCGDAAHLWIPAAGYGMNAGIADAVNLSWKIAGILDGWAEPEILDAYPAERQPITDQVSHIITDVARRVMKQRREVPPEVEQPGAVGDSVRERIAAEARAIDTQQQCAAGLNFGYFYDASPIIAYDGEPHPPYKVHEFTSSTVPGCRAPHVWLREGYSLYDALGPGYTLLRFDAGISVAGLSEAAARRRVPLRVLDVEPAQAQAAPYRHKLLLVRPDQHVAWRGDEEPASPLELIDLVRGASVGGEHTASPAFARGQTGAPAYTGNN